MDIQKNIIIQNNKSNDTQILLNELIKIIENVRVSNVAYINALFLQNIKIKNIFLLKTLFSKHTK